MSRCELFFVPLSSSDLTVIHCPFLFLHVAGVSLYKSIRCSIGLSVQSAIVFAVHLVLSQSQSRLTGVPVPQNFIHVVLGPDAQELFFVAPLLVFVFLVAVVLAVVAEAAHLPADVLKVLVDADLGKTLGVFLAGLVEHLALNVDVMRPVLGLEEGGLGKARPNGSDQEGREGHHEQKHPPTRL